jgi:hypothetical protein
MNSNVQWHRNKIHENTLLKFFLFMGIYIGLLIILIYIFIEYDFTIMDAISLFSLTGLGGLILPYINYFIFKESPIELGFSSSGLHFKYLKETNKTGYSNILNKNVIEFPKLIKWKFIENIYRTRTEDLPWYLRRLGLVLVIQTKSDFYTIHHTSSKLLLEIVNIYESYKLTGPNLNTEKINRFYKNIKDISTFPY